MNVKYPRTWHLSFSPGNQKGDKKLKNQDHFAGKRVVITEKIDGENTSMSSERYWARSLDSVDHPSRHYTKGIWGRIAHEIPTDWRICGENAFAEHSIKYDELESYFQVFSIWNERNEALSWSDTMTICETLGLKTVPIIYRGLYTDEVAKEIISKLNLTKQEGIVVRLEDSFRIEDFRMSVAKWVRKGHVKPNEGHWLQKPVVQNKLKDI